MTKPNVAWRVSRRPFGVPGHHTITRRIVTTRGTVSGPNTTEIDVL